MKRAHGNGFIGIATFFALCATASAQESSGPTFKFVKLVSHDNVCRLQINGLGDQTFMTGTGVDCTFATSVKVPNPNPNGWIGHIDKVEAIFGSDTAQIHPLEGQDPQSNPATVVGHAFRYDSTQVAGSLQGTTVVVKLKVDIHFLKYGPPPPEGGPPPIIGSEHDIQEVQVAPKAFNVGTINATSRDVFGTPPGWQSMQPIPAQYYWSAVSQEGANQARMLIPQGNYALTEDNLHTYSQLVASQAEYDVAFPNGPSAIRTLQLSKLLGQSTLLFNFSHGEATGFSDDSNPLLEVDWASGQRTVADASQGIYRNLLCRLVFLYSCSCGTTPASPKAGFRHNGVPFTNNAAIFAFSAPVFSTLKAGDRNPNLPYNNPDGSLALINPLYMHSSRVLRLMVGSQTATFAVDTANIQYPPRRFAYGANGINYTNVLDLSVLGDSDARLHGVYRKTTEGDSTHLQFGTWGLLDKLSEITPEENP